MSSYVNFYIKNNKKNVYTYLFGYSRSSKIYEAFYETMGCNRNDDGYCNELTKEDLIAIRSYIKDELARDKKSKADREQFMSQIGSWNNSVEDKLELINECREFINYLEEDIEALISAQTVYGVLYEMIDFNPDKSQLFAGIDCYISREEENECENN